jgi:hypothetical protein
MDFETEGNDWVVMDKMDMIEIQDLGFEIVKENKK